MKTGGYDALSTSNLTDNDSIQRKNSTAGDTITISAKASPIRPSNCRSGLMQCVQYHPVRPLAQPKQRTRQGDDQGEENDHNRGRVSDVVIDEGDAVKIEVDRFRVRAGAALGDGEDDVKTLHRVDHADHGCDEEKWHDQRQRDVAEY